MGTADNTHPPCENDQPSDDTQKLRHPPSSQLSLQTRRGSCRNITDLSQTQITITWNCARIRREIHPRRTLITLQLPKIIFGTMARRPTPDAERERLIRAAIDRGLTTLDTAPLYDFGRCEEQIGRALRGVPRDGYQILTKVGLRWDGDARGATLFSFTDGSGQRVEVRKDSRPESVRTEVERSLKRLDVEYIDLIQIHHPDTETPLEDTIGALLRLKERGWVREIGVSNFSRDQLHAARSALGEAPLYSAQEEYSLLRRELDDEIVPFCTANNVRVLAYSPLAGGAIGGWVPAIRDRGAVARLTWANQVLQEIAIGHGVSAAAVALAWTGVQHGIGSVIAGGSSEEQIQQHLKASALALRGDELAALTESFASVDWPRPWEQADSRLDRIVRRARRFAARQVRRLLGRMRPVICEPVR